MNKKAKSEPAEKVRVQVDPPQVWRLRRYSVYIGGLTYTKTR